ncbi:MAG: RHS repeat-associated core domain-containing protein, partial [Myxococcales bacterium]|nr:RHS repeat-associated core domain-containing protein [Myxococcales bacterium]
AADYSYTHTDGSRTPFDVASDWRTSLPSANDPMRPEPAPMGPIAPTDRVMTQTWSWDYLANQTDTGDQTSLTGGTFYERSLGAITNGDDDGDAPRPTAIYFAHNMDVASSPDQAGWLQASYGAGGNLVQLTVHAQCHAWGTSNPCTVSGTTLADEITSLDAEACICDNEQSYVYRWDELNRLAEARRYDRQYSTDWSLVVRQRYRYDGANQRTIKQTLDQWDCSPGTCERTALYVYPGDFERRGLTRGVGTYDASSALGTETQYVVAGARMVLRDVDYSSVTDDLYLREARMVTPVSDLIGTTNAAFDVRTGRLVEASTYYPNGARETLVARTDAAAEPMGFTGKEGDEEVGLVYFGERYLVPRLGRWASPDPMAVHQVGGGEALNSYHYVGGSFLAVRDPLGLDILFQHRTVFDASAPNNRRPLHSASLRERLEQATPQMVSTIRRQLWYYFAIGTRQLGSHELGTSVSGIRYTGSETISRKRRGEGADSHLARTRSAIWNRIIGGGGSRREAQAALQAFDQARARLIGYLRQGGRFIIGLSSRDYAESEPLLGGGQYHPRHRGSQIVMNPLYFNNLQGDARARVVFGPTITLLHESDHRDGLLDSSPGRSSRDETIDPDSRGWWNMGETYTTSDIDRVLGAVGLPQRGRYDDPDYLDELANRHADQLGREFQTQDGRSVRGPGRALANPSP